MGKVLLCPLYVHLRIYHTHAETEIHRPTEIETETDKHRDGQTDTETDRDTETEDINGQKGRKQIKTTEFWKLCFRLGRSFYIAQACPKLPVPLPQPSEC